MFCGDDELPYAVVVPHSMYPVDASPFGFTVPDSVADVPVMFDAEPLTTIGGPAVLNVLSRPFVVPPALEATMRKWYVVFGDRPVRSATAVTLAMAAPALPSGVEVP